MKVVDLSVNQISVLRFDPRREMVEFSLEYNDGQPREIRQMTRIGDPELMASKVLKRIREGVKQSFSPEFDDSPLAGIVSIRFRNDIDEMQDRLTNFFRTIVNGIRSSKMAKMSYGDMERKITGIKVLL